MADVYHSSEIPHHIAIGVYNRVLASFNHLFQQADALYIVDASVSAGGEVSASVFVFRDEYLRATVTIDDDDPKSRREYAEYNGRLNRVDDLPGQYLPL
ncbi:hypothetical protein PLEOSDRAFT_154770 [Pleurotus ostreatus PC15]|uniref:Uncharacterized protein n=1 Tax=Pleurotus ostreatus (strain PC15) TaxID=1137138 RepID=A0A067NSS6_PLEO1|nr:hypothetical protein PLEOSDRAFT_154770 [Pleurotus ostreatus PC15]